MAAAREKTEWVQKTQRQKTQLTKDPNDKRPNWQKTHRDKRPNWQKTQWQKTQLTKDPRYKRPTGTKDPIDKRPTMTKDPISQKKDPILPAEFRSKLKIRKQKIENLPKIAEKLRNSQRFSFSASPLLLEEFVQTIVWATAWPGLRCRLFPSFRYIVHNLILLTYTWINVCLISILCIKKYMLRNW